MLVNVLQKEENVLTVKNLTIYQKVCRANRNNPVHGPGTGTRQAAVNEVSNHVNIPGEDSQDFDYSF